MMTFIARMTVKEGQEEEFIRLIKALGEKVHANEPDCLYYRAFRLRDGERRFAVIESFKDEAAEETHRNAPWFTELVDPILATLDGSYEREYLDPLES
ncbi:MAG: putative quinol monooxygenase [Gammaproteobacteria bacterium]